MCDANTVQVSEDAMLESGRVAMCEAVEWFANCLEYGMGVEGAVWVRPDADTSRIAALLSV